ARGRGVGRGARELSRAGQPLSLRRDDDSRSARLTGGAHRGRGRARTGPVRHTARARRAGSDARHATGPQQGRAVNRTRKSQWWWMVAGAAGTALLAACGNAKPAAGGAGGGGGMPPMPVEAAAARPDTVVESIEATGQIEALQSVELRPEVEGRIAEI